MPQIRAASRSDAEAILVINRAGTPGVSLLSPAALAELFALSSALRVAHITGELIGYVIALAATTDYDGDEFRWFQGCYPDFLYIDQVAVAPQWRRATVGTLLYQDIEAYAQRQGIRRITCEVNLEPVNPVSLQFHVTRGYGEVATLTTRDGRLVSLRLKELHPAARS